MNLIDAIGKDIFIFEDNKYTDNDFKNMSSEDLATFKARISLKITDIADIIKARRKLEDGAWLARRKYALSLHTKIVPYINSLLKRRHKMERCLGDHFMDQARIVLSTEDYEMILRNAGREFRLGRDVVL